MKLQKEIIKSIEYYELCAQNPKDFEKGISSGFTFYHHRNCGGRIYIGDNGCFRYLMCKEEEETQCWNIDYSTHELYLNQSVTKRDVIQLSEMLIFVGQLVQHTGVRWLQRFLSNTKYIEK